jgi:DNA ligase-1
MTGFNEFVLVCRRIEGISGSIEMSEVVSEFLAGVDDDELEIATRFIMGQVFPPWSSLELGIGPNLLYTAIAKTAGIQVMDVKNLVRELGDVGETARSALEHKAQASFSSFFEERSSLTLRDVYHRFEAIATLSGKGSQSAKIRHLQYLFNNVSPEEAVYVARLAIEELRIGVGEGIVRDSIASAFHVDKELVERGYMLTNDLGAVALTAKREGTRGLESLSIALNRPIKMMLAQVAESIEGAIAEMGQVAVEWKFDGARVQIHKSGGDVSLYSRRLENVTGSLPELVERVRECVTAESAILDGEAVAIGEDGKPLAFQQILRRFRRKYDIKQMRREIPVTLNVFDVMYLNGESLIDLSLAERRKILESCVESREGLTLAEQTVTGDSEMVRRVYEQALAAGHEGVMLKNPGSAYTPGKRGKNWLKLKPVMETLDLVVVGGEWGEGRRAHFLGSYVLACVDSENNRYLEIGRVGTGMSDEQLKELTDTFRELIISEKGKDVQFEPRIVFEVAYEEIQSSPNYSAGYALRFPRLVRVRLDKSPEDADTIDRVEQLYSKQRR